ncbi:MAG: PHP domain-containing protein [Clostridia bacterium]|nr:PHP domain-containing protein [Clostridia bacterium]
MEYIDLHTHSHHSDGSMTPDELVKLAKETGLRAISLTDHDTFDGVKEAVEAGEKYGIEVIPGIEFSVVSTGETHILGYGIDITEKNICDAVTKAKELRLINNQRTADALQKLGFDITVEDARKISPVGNIGRAHFAKVMELKGYTSSVKEAFDLYLQKGRPAFNSLRLLEAEEAIKLIHGAGGKAFLAHLHLTKKAGQELEDYVKELKDYGLDGIEGYYTEYEGTMQEDYQALAKKYGLLISGGTDFHGANKPHIKLGVGYGNLRIPYSLLDQIRN